jgi:hypothetical protein
VHYTYTGPTSAAFDWRGSPNTIRYGRTRRYTKTAVAHTPNPKPYSSSRPFWEARLSRLRAGATYHCSIGGGRDHLFSTASTGPFRFDVEADVGSANDFPGVTTTERQIAADRPAFVLVVGDITHASDNGQPAVDQAFDDVMPWSVRRVHASRGKPRMGHADRRPPQLQETPVQRGTWPDWQRTAAVVMAAAQKNPKIHFIVTFGHRPASRSTTSCTSPPETPPR